MRFASKLVVVCWAAAALAAFSPASHGAMFWLSSDAADGCFDCVDPSTDQTAETVQILPGEPVVLTLWATLEEASDLTVISLELATDSSDSLDRHAIWMLNPLLSTANTYRHQTTLASPAADFVSSDLPPVADAAFPFCSGGDCTYYDSDDPDLSLFFGAASIAGLALPGDDGSDRFGVGIGATAKSLGDPLVVPAQGAVPDLWQVGLVEFHPVLPGTTRLDLFEGDALASGSGPPFSARTLVLTVEVVPDYNRDGKVGLADYTTWRDTLDEQVVCDGVNPCADGNGDGVVDQADLNLWRTYILAQGQSQQIAVPEPLAGAMLLTACGLIGLSHLGRTF